MGRIEKVNELIKRELGHMIVVGEISDPRVRHVTIQHVDVTKDLQFARVRFSLLSDKPIDVRHALEGLNSSKGYIRKLIGTRVKMRYTPEFQFFFDKGPQHAAAIDEALSEIKRLEGETHE